MIFHIRGVRFAVIQNSAVSVYPCNTVIRYFQTGKIINPLIGDTLGGKLCLHVKLGLLYIGKIFVQHAQYQGHGGGKHGDRHKADGTENTFCHILSSIR